MTEELEQAIRNVMATWLPEASDMTSQHAWIQGFLAGLCLTRDPFGPITTEMEQTVRNALKRFPYFLDIERTLPTIATDGF